MFSAKLTDNNPNIADLSDLNRPTKLAEQLSELYDNTWTDLFENLTEQNELDYQKAVEAILELFKVHKSTSVK